MSIIFSLQNSFNLWSVSISCTAGTRGGGVSLRHIGIRWLSLLKHQAKILNTALIECPSLGRGGPGVPPLGARGASVAVWGGLTLKPCLRH